MRFRAIIINNNFEVKFKWKFSMASYLLCEFLLNLWKQNIIVKNKRNMEWVEFEMKIFLLIRKENLDLILWDGGGVIWWVDVDLKIGALLKRKKKRSAGLKKRGFKGGEKGVAR